MTTVWIILLLLAVVAWVIYLFNALVGLSNRADAAWADIDTHLKRRYDLIPNLVDLVKAYSAHESGTFEKVAAARSAGQKAYSPTEKSQTEPAVVAGTRSLLAVAESYPQLKANEEFRHLSQTLTNIEDHLQQARRHYNGLVRDLNTRSQSFPNNLFAPLFGITSREYFQLDDRAEAAPPK
jgi:LemA protein